MSDPTKIHVHTSTDGPCGYCSGDDCPMRYCPGCPPGCPLAEELQAARAAVRSYETMLNWHVTCERCADQLDELYAATVAREVLAAALDSPPGAATLVELATEAARRLTGIADLDAERAVHMQRWAEQTEPMLGIRGHERECADRAGRRRELSRPFLGEGGE